MEIPFFEIVLSGGMFDERSGRISGNPPDICPTCKGGRETAMTGVLYGIGVGPGDPELLTLKAVRKIQACDVIAVPGKDYRESIA